jgi:hypothetical protein
VVCVPRREGELLLQLLGISCQAAAAAVADDAAANALVAVTLSISRATGSMPAMPGRAALLPPSDSQPSAMHVPRTGGGGGPQLRGRAMSPRKGSSLRATRRARRRAATAASTSSASAAARRRGGGDQAHGREARPPPPDGVGGGSAVPPVRPAEEGVAVGAYRSSALRKKCEQVGARPARGRKIDYQSSPRTGGARSGYGCQRSSGLIEWLLPWGGAPPTLQLQAEVHAAVLAMNAAAAAGECSPAMHPAAMHACEER